MKRKARILRANPDETFPEFSSSLLRFVPITPAGLKYTAFACLSRPPTGQNAILRIIYEPRRLKM